MGKVIVLPETTKNPITLMGQRAGVCVGVDTTDPEKNYKRGLTCLESNHGRVLEYVNVEIILQGYSARVIREWYTHIGGSPTRLQASTRYINYNDFKFVIPDTIKESSGEVFATYIDTMHDIAKACEKLELLGIPREDAALLLPLGMETTIVDKRNLRNYIDMAHQRMCTRAYHEYRRMFEDISNELSKVSDEWNWIVKEYFIPKCEYLGGCPEKKGCGYYERTDY